MTLGDNADGVMPVHQHDEWVYEDVYPLGTQRVCMVCGHREQWDT